MVREFIFCTGARSATWIRVNTERTMIWKVHITSRLGLPMGTVLPLASLRLCTVLGLRPPELGMRSR